jgi:hypothetical protein
VEPFSWANSCRLYGCSDARNFSRKNKIVSGFRQTQPFIASYFYLDEKFRQLTIIRLSLKNFAIIIHVIWDPIELANVLKYIKLKKINRFYSL